MNKYVKTLQVWSVLCLAAQNRQTLTYATVANLIGVIPQSMANYLTPIHLYCSLNKLPYLTLLVVNKDGKVTKFPVENIDMDHERALIYKQDWSDVKIPTLEELQTLTEAIKTE